MRRILAVCSCLFISFCPAQDSSPPKDYSAGLNKILSLGLPDFSDATLVNLHWNQQGTIPFLQSAHGSFYSQAWVLDEQPDGFTRLFLIPQLCEVQLKKVSPQEMMEGYQTGTQKALDKASWTPTQGADSTPADAFGV